MYETPLGFNTFPDRLISVKIVETAFSSSLDTLISAFEDDVVFVCVLIVEF